jgi:hypothetical protein
MVPCREVRILLVRRALLRITSTQAQREAAHEIDRDPTFYRELLFWSLALLMVRLFLSFKLFLPSSKRRFVPDNKDDTISWGKLLQLSPVVTWIPWMLF